MDKSTEIRKESVELLRSAAQNEYSNEHERTRTMDTKAGIGLPIVAAYFLSLAQMNDYKTINETVIVNIQTLIEPVLLFIAYTTALVFSFFAVVWMARVMFTREYKILNLQSLYTDDYLKSDCRVLSIKFLELYFAANEHNRKENDVRVRLYQRSWIFTFISVISFVIYVITKNNM